MVSGGNDAGGSESGGGAQNRPDVVRIGDLVEHQECRLRPGF
jgi:hypothetical protein